MRRKDKLVHGKAVLDKVIKESQVCRIALVNENNPYLIPMSFGYDGQYIYLHSAKQGQKIIILEKNPRVCVEFEDKVQVLKGNKPCNWGVRYISVIGHGWAEEITDEHEKNYGLSQIFNQYEPEITAQVFTPEELASVVVYKIHLEEIYGKISGMSLDDYHK